MAEEIANNKGESHEKGMQRGQAANESAHDRFREEFLNEKMSSRGQQSENSHSQGRIDNNVKGIWTTYDKDGNPTSDCHGPIPRHGGGIDISNQQPGKGGGIGIDISNQQPGKGGPVEDPRHIPGQFPKDGPIEIPNPFPPVGRPPKGGPIELPNPLPPVGHPPIELPNPFPPVGRPPIESPDKPYRPDRPPMGEKEMTELSRDIADKISEGKGTFGSPEEKQQLMKQLTDAEERGDLKLLIAKINEELALKGSDLHIDFKATHEQSDYWPELNPFNSWNRYNISLTADNGDVMDSLRFKGKVTYHPGIRLMDKTPEPVIYD